MKATVGIKEANGNFYPIVEVNSTARKRLLLTTAHDDQKSVQIDLYKSNVKSMRDALYLGSIVVENIAPKSKGVSSIEMILKSGSDGVISVDVTETENPSNHYHLTISLNSLEEDKRKYPDFESGGNKARVKRVKQDRGRPRKFPWGALILGALILALALLALWYFLFNGNQTVNKLINRLPLPGKTSAKTDTGKTVREASAVTEPVIIERPPEPPPVTETPASPAPAETPAPAPAKSSAGTASAAAEKPAPASSGRTANRINAPRTIPPEGVMYKVRWGDTLWDISAAFYRNPRLYPFIARSNNIANPNRIISGTELTILPRN